jgi:hypothetical protein
MRGAAERWSGGVVEWWSGGAAERWRSGGVEEWRSGGLQNVEAVEIVERVMKSGGEVERMSGMKESVRSGSWDGMG